MKLRIPIILLMLLFIIIGSMQLFAQILKPVKWSYASKRTGKDEGVIFIKANIETGWHIYSQFVKGDGPLPTSFKFQPSADYELIGEVSEPKAITRFEKAFGINVSYFEQSVIFQQKCKLKSAHPVVKGSLEYMTCNDQKCLPPDDVDFSITMK